MSHASRFAGADAPTEAVENIASANSELSPLYEALACPKAALWGISAVYPSSNPGDGHEIKPGADAAVLPAILSPRKWSMAHDRDVIAQVFH